MQIEFLAAAREEFLNAVSYYDSEKQGLGDEFYDEVWRTNFRIVSHPLRGRQSHQEPDAVLPRGFLTARYIRRGQIQY